METSCTSLTWRITTRKRWTKMTKRTRNASSTPSRKRWRSSATHIMTNTKNTRKGVSVCHRLYICRCCLWNKNSVELSPLLINQLSEASFSLWFAWYSWKQRLPQKNRVLFLVEFSTLLSKLKQSHRMIIILTKDFVNQSWSRFAAEQVSLRKCTYVFTAVTKVPDNTALSPWAH